MEVSVQLLFFVLLNLSSSVLINSCAGSYSKPRCANPLQRRDRSDGNCYRINRQIPCQEDNKKFYPIDEKQGTCDCQADLALLYWPSTDVCYHQNTQGPCPNRQWITWNGTATVCQTVPEGCQADGLHFYWRLSEDEPLGCYEVNHQGPCPTGFRFRRFHYFSYCSDNFYYEMETSSPEYLDCPLGSRRALEKLCIPLAEWNVTVVNTTEEDISTD